MLVPLLLVSLLGLGWCHSPGDGVLVNPRDASIYSLGIDKDDKTDDDGDDDDNDYEEEAFLVSYANGSAIPGLAKLREAANNALIASGRAANPDAHPHMVSIQYIKNGKAYHVCSGFLARYNKVVTAAQCAFFFKLGLPHIVALGYHQLSLGLRNPESQIIAVKSMTEQPGYAFGGSVPNDVAVLTLEISATRTQHVKTAYVAYNEPSSFENKEVTMFSWGLLERNKTFADILHSEIYKVMSQSKCQSYWPGVQILPQHICAKPIENAVSLCHGDVGNPLQFSYYGSPYIIGVGSIIPIGCSPEVPSIFNSPGSNKNWLLESLSEIED